MVENIREAEKEDIDRIVELEKISLGPVWDGDDIEYEEGNIRDFLQNTFGRTTMLIYEEDEKLLGFLHSNTYEDVVTGKKICEIFTLSIHPDHFGEKIGGNLIDTARERADEEDADILKLETLSSNERAIKFYQKKGFSEKKKIMTSRLSSDKEDRDEKGVKDEDQG